MWPLAVAALVTLVALALRRTRWAALSLRVSRWTYALFIVFGLLYFPLKSGFAIAPPVCQWTFGLALAARSLRNFPHIIMFTLFFLLTYAQLRGVPRPALWSAAACVVMGLLVELAQGATGQGNCRMRDLIPDAAGAAAGALLVAAGSRLWTQRRSADEPVR